MVLSYPLAKHIFEIFIAVQSIKFHVVPSWNYTLNTITNWVHYFSTFSMHFWGVLKCILLEKTVSKLLYTSYY